MAESQEAPRFLLLLPPIPPADFEQVRSGIFGDTISQVLKEVAQHSTESLGAVKLEIAVTSPEWNETRATTYPELFQRTQTLLATVYKLIGVIATRDNIDLDEGNGVDVRAILVAWSPDGQPSIQHRPVINLQTLAASQRQWQWAFGVENEAGEELVEAFVAARSHPVEMTNSQPATSTTDADKVGIVSTHQDVILGGTFDHLHIGHKLLLTMLLYALPSPGLNKSPQTATIGLTGDQLLGNKKYSEVLQSWDQRQASVYEFLDAITNFTPQAPSTTRRNEPGPNGKSVGSTYQDGLTIICTEIQDPFGPTITEEHLTALIISAETRSGGRAVNDKRVEKGWEPLEILEVDVLHVNETAEITAGFDGKISSTGIRQRVSQRRAQS